MVVSRDSKSGHRDRGHQDDTAIRLLQFINQAAKTRFKLAHRRFTVTRLGEPITDQDHRWISRFHIAEQTLKPVLRAVKTLPRDSVDIIPRPTQITKRQFPIGTATLQFCLETPRRLHPFDERAAENRNAVVRLQ